VSFIAITFLLLLNECLLLSSLISLSTQSGHFWIHFRMYVCMYYVCMHACMYLCMHVYIYTYWMEFMCILLRGKLHDVEYYRSTICIRSIVLLVDIFCSNF
jgi:hypothetical protein